MNAKKFFLFGLLLYLLSFLQYILPKNLLFLFLSNVFFLIGISLISESITRHFHRKSLILQILQSRKNIINFAAVSVIGGLIIDAIAAWLGKLWVYPFFTPLAYYLLLAIPGWSLYWLMIAESYLAFKSLFGTVIKPKKEITKPYQFEKPFFRLIGCLGLVFLLTSVYLLTRDLIKNNIDIFNINEPIFFQVNFVLVILIFIGVWFVLEYFEFRKKCTSLIKDIFHHYPVPFLSIIFASFLLAIMYEFENIPSGFWLYTNWPLSNIKLVGLPITMFLAWPLHYIAFLSFFRVLTENEANDIWRIEN